MTTVSINLEAPCAPVKLSVSVNAQPDKPVQGSKPLQNVTPLKGTINTVPGMMFLQLGGSTGISEEMYMHLDALRNLQFLRNHFNDPRTADEQFDYFASINKVWSACDQYINKPLFIEDEDISFYISDNRSKQFTIKDIVQKAQSGEVKSSVLTDRLDYYLKLAGQKMYAVSADGSWYDRGEILTIVQKHKNKLYSGSRDEESQTVWDLAQKYLNNKPNGVFTSIGNLNDKLAVITKECDEVGGCGFIGESTCYFTASMKEIIKAISTGERSGNPATSSITDEHHCSQGRLVNAYIQGVQDHFGYTRNGDTFYKEVKDNYMNVNYHALGALRELQSWVSTMDFNKFDTIWEGCKKYINEPLRFNTSDWYFDGTGVMEIGQISTRKPSNESVINVLNGYMKSVSDKMGFVFKNGNWYDKGQLLTAMQMHRDDLFYRKNPESQKIWELAQKYINHNPDGSNYNWSNWGEEYRLAHQKIIDIIDGSETLKSYTLDAEYYVDRYIVSVAHEFGYKYDGNGGWYAE